MEISSLAPLAKRPSSTWMVSPGAIATARTSVCAGTPSWVQTAVTVPTKSLVPRLRTVAVYASGSPVPGQRGVSDVWPLPRPVAALKTYGPKPPGSEISWYV